MGYSNINGIELGQFNEIMGELGYYGNEVFYMGELSEVFGHDVEEAIMAAFYGGRYKFSQDPFNPNDEYFSFDGYGNLESIPNEHYLQDYFDQFRDEILEYVNENGIELYGVEEEDDDE